MSGDYDLLNYAATQWLNQIKQCTEGLHNPEKIKDLCREIEDMVERRKNPDYVETKNRLRGNAMAFKVFEDDWPQLCEILILEDSFWAYEAPFMSLNDGTT